MRRLPVAILICCNGCTLSDIASFFTRFGKQPKMVDLLSCSGFLRTIYAYLVALILSKQNNVLKRMGHCQVVELLSTVPVENFSFSDTNIAYADLLEEEID